MAEIRALAAPVQHEFFASPHSKSRGDQNDATRRCVFRHLEVSCASPLRSGKSRPRGDVGPSCCCTSARRRLPGHVAASRRWWAEVLRRTPELWILGVLWILAALSGPRLDDDSYGHYARSTRYILGLDLSSWITDVWNKPLPGLAYGLGSLLGAWGARAVACSFTVGAAYFTRKLLTSLLPRSSMVSTGTTLLFFAQPALVKDAFVTMTEVPAAMFVAWSLYALSVQRRPAKAALLAGLVPLCRVEMVPVVAVTALYCGYEQWRTLQLEPQRRPWLQLGLTVGLAGVPFVVWYGAGFAATGDVGWFSRASYAYLRTNWELPALLHHNVFTGLVNVVPPPLLLLLIYGAFTWWGRAFRARRDVVGHLLLLLGVHYLLLNTLVVYPKDWFGVPPGHGVAAINGRNYTSSAPVLVALLVLGLAVEYRLPIGGVASPALGVSTRRRLGGLVAAAFTSLGLVYLSKGNNVADFALHVALLFGGLGLMAWSIARDARIGSVPDAFSRPLKLAALTGAIGALVVRPFFWYPTVGTDLRATAIAELARRIADERPGRVIQDTASFLEVAALELGLDVSASETQWTWPGEYPRRLAHSAAGTWVVLELNPRGEPLSRYPSALMAQLRSGAFEPVGQFQTTPHRGIWALFDRVSARNAAIGWKVFRSRPPMATELASSSP